MDVHDQGRPEVLERRADPAELVRARLGAGLEPRLRRRLQLPVQLHRRWPGEARRRRRTRSTGVDRGRRRDDPHGQAVGAVLELRHGRRIPAVLPDAVCGRRADRPERVGERPDDRQRSVQAREAADRPGDRRSSATTSGPATSSATRRRSSTRSPSLPTADPDTAYNSFEAGEGDNANIPPGRVHGGAGQLRHHARRAHPRLVPLRDQCGRPGRRRSGEQAAPAGDLAGDRPRRDQPGGLRRHPHRRRPASRRSASRASRRACATTAPTTPKPRSRRSTTGRRPATSSRSRSGSSSTPVPGTRTSCRSSSTT